MMYSTKTNIAQLTALMIEHGVQEVVISPGSRNMPLAQTLASCPAFHCHAVTDERSAGFFALGIAQSKQAPVAVCVTSGSALLNLTSAVSEAYYQELPLLVLSADRPQSWIGQMDGQTIPQMGVFGTLIKKSLCLCEPNNETEKWYNNRMINEALIALKQGSFGPVHINIPITEPFFDCSATTLPSERVIELWKVNHPSLQEQWRQAKAPIIIVGQLAPQTAAQLSPILQSLGVPVLCESLANLHGEGFCHAFDLILISKEKRAELAPDLVVYMGGHLVSKRLKQWLRSVQPAHVWRISPEGTVADTFQSLTAVIPTEPISFAQTLIQYKTTHHNDSWLKWQAAEKKVQAMVSFPQELTALRVASDLCQEIPSGAALVLANSSSVRYAQLAKMKEEISVYCNRGVNGIDGSLSSAVGIAMAERERPVYLLIGDLSFFYDMNALWNTKLPDNLHILIINNGCGEIFRTLPGLKESKETQQYVMATHQTNAQGWVESMGCAYKSVREWNEYVTSMKPFILHQGEKPMVLEIFTDPLRDEEAHKAFYKIFETIQ